MRFRTVPFCPVTKEGQSLESLIQITTCLLFTFLFIIHTLYYKNRGDFMGLTSSSTGNKLLNNNLEILKNKCNYTVAIARKSKCR